MAAIDLRYARALAAVISDQKLDAVAAQGNLNDFADTLDDSAELREVLGDPSIPEAQKLKVLDGIAQRMHMSQPVRNFLAVITHHQRLEELRDIIAGYASLVDADTQVGGSGSGERSQAGCWKSRAAGRADWQAVWRPKSAGHVQRRRNAAGRRCGAAGVDGV